MSAPLMKAEKDRSIRVDDLAEVVVGGRRFRQAKQGCVPPEAARYVGYADNRPNAFHILRPIPTMPQARRWFSGIKSQFFEFRQGFSRSLATGNQSESDMGNRARRRVWAQQVNCDPRLNEPDRRAALAVAEMDRKGFTLCEIDGDFFFVPKDQWRLARAA